jgi:beta-xylosidase
MGIDYCYLRVKQIKGKLFLSQMVCKNADMKQLEEEIATIELKNNLIYLKVKVENTGECSFYYSEEDKNFIKIGSPFIVKEGKWIGSKIGFVALRDGFINDAGNIKLDWIRFNR